ncbi:MAG: XdhC family protein, partial [Chloroflexota bacterium]
ASAERFPSADQILLGPYRETIAGIETDSDSYIVLVTRGHVHDQACLEHALGTAAAYIGMIGSRRRVRTVMSHLRDAGYPAERLEAVHAPVGLDIGAQTPAEIALAVMAEIVNVRRGGKATSLMLGERLRV